MYLLCMFSSQHSRELSKNRGARKSVRESVFLSCLSHQPVLRPAPFPTDKLNLSSSYSLIQILSMRTWRWGQTERATRRRGLPLMRCSRPRVFVWGTEGTDASLQRWGLFPCVFILLFKLRICCLIWYDNMATIKKCLTLEYVAVMNRDTFIPTWLQRFSLHFVVECMVWLSKEM